MARERDWSDDGLMEMDMVSTDSADRAARLEQLSALADGELGDAAVAQVCAHWRIDADSREAWHAFHLIGDVLRSEDLAGNPARDAGFFNALQARLAAEPVVLAPEPLARPSFAASKARWLANGARSSRRFWIAPSVVAAGFVAVAGVVMLTRAPGPLPASQSGTTLAQGAPALVGVQGGNASSPATIAVAADPQVLVANGQLIRDVRLDRYLAAHKQFAGTSALGVPSGFLRSATADAADR